MWWVRVHYHKATWRLVYWQLCSRHYTDSLRAKLWIIFDITWRLVGSNSERSSNYGIIYRTLHGKPSWFFFSSKLFDEPIFRQCAQSIKRHFDKVTFRRNSSLDEVSFDEVSHFDAHIIKYILIWHSNSIKMIKTLFYAIYNRCYILIGYCNRQCH